MKETFTKIWNLIKESSKDLWYFVSSPVFIKNFTGMLVLSGVLLLLTSWWMRCYTNHGESLQVHNYIGMPLEDAISKAESRTFSIIVNDSIFVVGKPPLEVLDQNPKPLSRVKEQRKIYLTVSKASPDMIKLPDITEGNDDYNQYRRILRTFSIEAKIKDRKFSNKLEPNTIIDVLYNGKEITEQLADGFEVPMGSTIEFVVTEQGGGTVEIPNLVCKDYDAASFLIGNFNLNIGSIISDATVTDQNSAYVWKQNPRYRAGKSLRIGAQVDLYLTQYKPEECNSGSNPSIERGTDDEENEEF